MITQSYHFLHKISQMEVPIPIPDSVPLPISNSTPDPVPAPSPISPFLTTLYPLFDVTIFPEEVHKAYLKYQTTLNRMIAEGYSFEYQTTYLFAIRELSTQLDHFFTKNLSETTREGMLKASASAKSAIYYFKEEYLPAGQEKPIETIYAISKKISYEKSYNSLRKVYKIDYKVIDNLTEILIQNTLATAPTSPPGLFPKIYSVYSHSPYISKYPCALQPENGPGYAADHTMDIYIDMEYINADTLDLYLKSALSLFQRASQLGNPATEKKIKRKIRLDILEIYMRIARQLIPLQEEHEFIHGDLKGSNILLHYWLQPVLKEEKKEEGGEKEADLSSSIYPGIDLQRISLIDFEYSHIKVDGDHIFAQTLFSFDENYDRYNMADPSNVFGISEDGFLHPAPKIAGCAAGAMGYDLDFAQSYASPHRFRMDLLYLLLSTAHIGPCWQLFCRHFFTTFSGDRRSPEGSRESSTPDGTNLFRKIVMNHLEFEAFVYSKDMDLMRKICVHYGMPFEAFMEQFEPMNFISKLQRIYSQISTPA